MKEKKKSVLALNKWEEGKIEIITSLNLQKGFILNNIRREYIGTTSEKRIDAGGVEFDFIHYLFEYKFNISHKDHRDKVYYSGSMLTNATKNLRKFANNFLKENHFYKLEV